MNSIDQLQIDLIRLSELKKAMEPYEELKKEEAELRQAILTGMQAQKSKRTDAINGYFAVRSETRSVKIADPKAIESWITENGYTLDEYKRLDAAMIKQLNESVEKKYNTTLPGLDVELNETVSIRREKEAKDASRK